MFDKVEVLDGFDFIDGVYCSQKSMNLFSEFETAYLDVREKEKRILSIAEIRNLPFVSKESSDYDLWQIRRKSIQRFLKHLSNKKNLKVLDIGCGNGFFTNLIAKKNHKVFGLDINQLELKQAAQAFPSKDIHWFYADIIHDTLPIQKFDIITFCSSFHFFQHPNELFKHCLSLLNENGEIHIIDSPFYTEENKIIAKQNSKNYFHKIGVSKMENYFQHNSFKVLKDFHHQIAYQPRGIIKKLLRRKDSPFPWIIIRPL